MGIWEKVRSHDPVGFRVSSAASPMQKMDVQYPHPVVVLSLPTRYLLQAPKSVIHMYLAFCGPPRSVTIGLRCIRRMSQNLAYGHFRGP